MPEVIRVGREVGVSWVAPTSHATNTVELAQIAEALGLHYVSPTSVENVENKIKFYKILEDAGIPILPYYQCDNADEITACVGLIDGPAILKGENATSAKSQQIIYPGMSMRDREQLVMNHIEVREHYGLGSTIVQQFAGNYELGYQAIILAIDEGLQIPWSMTTRKHMIEPVKILIDHVYDPTDKRHSLDTTRFVQPTMSKVVAALNEAEPSMQGLPNTPFNADLIKWKGVLYPIDASFRWRPRALRESSATLGLHNSDPHFLDVAIKIARGREINPEDIVPFGPQRPPRSFVNRRAYTNGGVLVQHRPSRSFLDREYYSEIPRAGTRIPNPGEALQNENITTYPLICTEGVDRDEAERRWRTAMARTGLACVGADSVMRGYSDGKNGQGRKWGRRL